MPVYEYKCACGLKREIKRPYPLRKSPKCKCGELMDRVFHAPGIIFKGSGFYKTDYGYKKKGGKDG